MTGSRAFQIQSKVDVVAIHTRTARLARSKQALELLSTLRTGAGSWSNKRTPSKALRHCELPLSLPACRVEHALFENAILAIITYFQNE